MRVAIPYGFTLVMKIKKKFINTTKILVGYKDKDKIMVRITYYIEIIEW